MPDWKRIIVGDAFALQSNSPNFYRDLFLLVPFLLFSIMAVSGLFSPRHEYLFLVKCWALALLLLALMRERRIMIGAGLGFVSVQSLVSAPLQRSWSALVISILAGLATFLLIRSLKSYEPSYSVERGGTIASLLVVMAGGLFWYVLLGLLLHR